MSEVRILKQNSHPLFTVSWIPSSDGPSSEFFHISPVLIFLRELFLELQSRFCLHQHFSPLNQMDYGQLGFGYWHHSDSD
jgi:hypothetical protein